MDKKMKLKKKDKLGYSFCDITANLSAVGAFQIIEDAITEMMGALKLDGETCLREYDAMWVYVKNRIEIRDILHWIDEYTIESYVSDANGVKLIVDTVIKNKNKIVVASRAELCALDHSSGRIRRSNTVGIDENFETEQPEIDIEFDNTKFVPNELIDTVIVRSSDIDFNHHTNNISYVRYLVDQFNTDSRSKKNIISIEICYKNQTFEGDILKVYRCSNNDFTILCNGNTVVNCSIK